MNSLRFRIASLLFKAVLVENNTSNSKKKASTEVITANGGYIKIFFCQCHFDCLSNSRIIYMTDVHIFVEDAGQYK